MRLINRHDRQKNKQIYCIACLEPIDAQDKDISKQAAVQCAHCDAPYHQECISKFNIEHCNRCGHSEFVSLSKIPKLQRRIRLSRRKPKNNITTLPSQEKTLNLAPILYNARFGLKAFTGSVVNGISVLTMSLLAILFAMSLMQTTAFRSSYEFVPLNELLPVWISVFAAVFSSWVIVLRYSKTDKVTWHRIFAGAGVFTCLLVFALEPLLWSHQEVTNSGEFNNWGDSFLLRNLDNWTDFIGLFFPIVASLAVVLILSPFYRAFSARYMVNLALPSFVQRTIAVIRFFVGISFVCVLSFFVGRVGLVDRTAVSVVEYRTISLEISMLTLFSLSLIPAFCFLFCRSSESSTIQVRLPKLRLVGIILMSLICLLLLADANMRQPYLVTGIATFIAFISLLPFQRLMS